MQQPQQQQQQLMQPHMGPFSPHNVTTELIQKYLDENKHLILAILDNQNLGKLNECAQYQARLQANLMYLAAIADAQPQPPSVHSQVPPQAVLQSGTHYMIHPQAQQQMAQQSLMTGRNPLQYSQQPIATLHQTQQQQHQQSIHGQHGLNSGANNGLHMLHMESSMAGNSTLSSGGFLDFGRTGNTGEDMQVGRNLTGDMRGIKSDVAISGAGHSIPSDGPGCSVSGQAAVELEPSYLKASEEDGN